MSESKTLFGLSPCTSDTSVLYLRLHLADSSVIWKKKTGGSHHHYLGACVFCFTWYLCVVRGAGSAVAWERVGVMTRVATWAGNIITVIVVDVWYLLHLVHGVHVVGRFHS